MAEIVMPQLGESVTEGTITRWFKQVGESVAEDEPLFEVSTDKVDTEVPATQAGVLSEIRVPEGDTVDVGTVLAVLGDGAAAPGGDAEAPGEPTTAEAAAPQAAPAPAAPPPSPTAPAEPAAAPVRRPRHRPRPRRPSPLRRPPARPLRPMIARRCCRRSCAVWSRSTASTRPRSPGPASAAV